MKLWKHIIEEENLGIVLAPNRKSAERIWKGIYPQSEQENSHYFMEEAIEFSEIDEPEGIVKDWNEQLDRRTLMEHNISYNEFLCPLSEFKGASCKNCLSWTICAFNEYTDFLVDDNGRLYENTEGRELTSSEFERRQKYEQKMLEKLKEHNGEDLHLNELY